MNGRAGSIIVCAVLALSSTANAQVLLANDETKAAANDARIAEVIAIVERLDQALVTDDRAQFAAVMGKELVVNNPQNAISRPGAAVARNAAGNISYDRYERTIEYAGMRDRFVLLMGGEVVVPKGKDMQVRRRFTDLWEPVDGKWKLSARQATIIPET